MHISFKEAIGLLEAWRKGGIPLRVHLRGRPQAVNATVREIEGSVVALSSDAENLNIDLQGADFNGDGRPEQSGRGAYLVGEFPNGDRISFYVRDS